MQNFFHSALPQKSLLRRQTVEFLVQPAHGHHGNGTLKLRLSKQEAQHGNRQIYLRDSQHPKSISGGGLSQGLHKFNRLVLASPGIVSTIGNGNSRQATSGQREPLRRRVLDPF